MRDPAWLTRLAAYGLPGAGSPGKPEGAVVDALDAVARHKLIGVLQAAVTEGPVPLAEHEAAVVADAHETAMREVLLLEDVLLDALDVLEGAGVECRVLKGSALAHLICSDAAERTFGDNDVLVRGEQLDRALDSLLAAGAVRPVPPLTGDFDRRFAKSVTLGWHGPSELDLHRTLAPGPYGLLVRLDDLMRDGIEFPLAGRLVPTLPLPLHLVHAALHVALGDVEPRLGNLRDLALLAWGPDIEVDEVVAIAHEWGCVAPMARGLQMAGALGHTPSPVERWAAQVEFSPNDHRRLAAYSRRENRFRRQALESFRVLGWHDRVAFGRAMMLPRRANLAARGRGRLRRRAR